MYATKIQENNAEIAALRHSLWREGYRPIVLRTGHKAADIVEWQIGARSNPPDAVRWPVTGLYRNTGFTCAGLQVIDADIDDGFDSLAVQDAALRIFGSGPIRTRAGSSRWAILYRAEGEPGKQVIRGADDRGHIDILGRGGYIFSHGRHPSGAYLEWTGWRRRSELGSITPVQIDEFRAAVGDIIGVKDASGSAPDAGTGQHTGSRHGALASIEDIASALDAIRNDDRYHRAAWIEMGMAIKSASGNSDEGFDLFDAWSATNAKYNEATTLREWGTLKPTRKGFGSIHHAAKVSAPGWMQPSHCRSALDEFSITPDAEALS